MKNKKTQMLIWIDAATKKELQLYCVQHNKTMSEVVTHAIQEKLQYYPNKKKEEVLEHENHTSDRNKQFIESSPEPSFDGSDFLDSIRSDESEESSAKPRREEGLDSINEVLK